MKDPNLNRLLSHGSFCSAVFFLASPVFALAQSPCTLSPCWRARFPLPDCLFFFCRALSLLRAYPSPADVSGPPTAPTAEKSWIDSGAKTFSETP